MWSATAAVRGCDQRRCHRSRFGQRGLSSVAGSMRDDLMGGMLGTVVATPVLIICCGGGGVLLAGILGAVVGWMSGLGGIAVLIAPAAAALAWRTLRRRNRFEVRCVSLTTLEAERNRLKTRTASFWPPASSARQSTRSAASRRRSRRVIERLRDRQGDFHG